MPTHNPRLTITLDPAVAARLRRASELTGNSQGSMVAEILEQASPVFDRMIQVLEAAAAARQAVREETAASLARAQHKIEKQIGLALETFDDGTASLIDDIERVKRRKGRPKDGGMGARSRAPRTTAEGVATPPSNRGVRSDNKSSKNPALARVSSPSAREKSNSGKTAKKLYKNPGFRRASA